MLVRRSFFLLLSSLALAGCGTPPVARAAGHLVSVQIVDRSRGEVLTEHRHRGNRWVAGRPGERYAVRLTNRSGARVLVVLSVDGVNAISGESAATAQTGYVLAPWQSAEITGWRKSDREAAAFYFTALPDSYAARTGRPHNVGVIGAAVFREKLPEPPPAAFERAERAAAPPAAAADSAVGSAQAARERDASGASELRRQSSKLGTGHGEREWSPVDRTTFERASAHPAEIVQIRYDSHANLVAAGVIASPPRWGAPDPFPGYVPDPP